ncbi:MAG: AAA family ATPase, partial [Cellvibrionaceae bacterium]|nr:AAA family ATPase [Cellvibrionaceae bacterium]
MYCDHFNLKQRPFSLTPDTSFFFSGLPQRQALNTLAIGLARGDGFIKISGEVGTGKTSLARKLIAELGDDAVVAHINNSYLDPAELKLALAHELGVSLSHQLPSY